MGAKSEAMARAINAYIAGREPFSIIKGDDCIAQYEPRSSDGWMVSLCDHYAVARSPYKALRAEWDDRDVFVSASAAEGWMTVRWMVNGSKALKGRWMRWPG